MLLNLDYCEVTLWESFVLLTNQWTEYPHGHARTELRLVKELLEERGIRSEILSNSSEFGDLYSKTRCFSRLIPKKIIRGPLYRFKVKFDESEKSRTWQSELSHRAPLYPLVVTSGFWSQLLNALNKSGINRIWFRLISPPAKCLASAPEIQLVLEAIRSGRLFLGVETTDGLNYLNSHFGINAKLVPPITSVTKDVIKGNRVGIIWSVTDPATISEIKSELSYFDPKEILVKLPIGIDPKELDNMPNGIEVIPNGISDDCFSAQIEKLDFAYLPHKDYLLRGSGLITSLLGSGVVVFTHANNSFVQDFSFSTLLIPINENDMKAKIFKAKVFALKEIDRKAEADKVNMFVNAKWLDFLDPQIE
jgi:hypothetical protein